MCGSTRILCKFQKYVIIRPGPAPPSSPLCSEQDRLYLPYNQSNTSQIHTGVQKDEFWRGGGIDFRFELFVHLIPRLHYLLRAITLFGLGFGSSGVEESAQSARHHRGSLRGSHQEEITTSRSDADEKNTQDVTSFVQVSFFFSYCSIVPIHDENVTDVSIKTCCHCSGDNPAFLSCCVTHDVIELPTASLQGKHEKKEEMWVPAQWH